MTVQVNPLLPQSASATQDPPPMAHGHGRAWQSFEKLGAPVNKLLNRVGSEAFWPTSLEEESEKAGRILKAFCKEGVHASISQGKRESKTDLKLEARNDLKSDRKGKSKKNEHDPMHDSNTEILPEYSQELSQAPITTTTPKGPRVLIKIPPSVIRNAVGLAIFTVARAGTWGASLACGSGILIARKPDNTWSSPSGIIVNTLGLGFLAGIDVYDCVVVINTLSALEKFKSTRVSLGGEVSVTAGPWGAGGNIDFAVGKGQVKPVFTYIKSRGLYAGVQVDGTVIGVRGDENARFYGESVTVEEVLSGMVRRWTGLEAVVSEVERGVVVGGLGGQLRDAPVLFEYVDKKGDARIEDEMGFKGDVKSDENRFQEGAVDFKDDKTEKFGVVEETGECSHEMDQTNVPSMKSAEKRADDDGEWEDAAGFDKLDQKTPLDKGQDEGEWEDERKFYDMDEKKESAWEKNEHFA